MSFRERVLASLDAILSGAGGRNVVVFTSGGPIGVCVQQSLGAPVEAFLALNWRIRNASVTEFTFGGGGRISLDAFNGLSHLDDRSMWSWR